MAILEKKVRVLETDLLIKSSSPMKRSHASPTVQHMIEDTGLNGTQRVKSRIGTRGSISTSTILQAVNEETRTQAHTIAGEANLASSLYFSFFFFLLLLLLSLSQDSNNIPPFFVYREVSAHLPKPH